jgi:hypothetical protein
MPRVRLLRHIARLVAPLVINYFASCRFVIDNFTYVVRPGASAHCAARQAARRRLLHLRCASGCFGTSHDLSHDSSSTTSPRAGSSSTTSPTLRVWLLRLCRASRCLGMSSGSSCGSSRRLSSTTSSPPRVRVPRHVARLVAPLVVDYFAVRKLVIDYFAYAARPGASARHAARQAARRRLLHLRCASGC